MPPVIACSKCSVNVTIPKDCGAAFHCPACGELVWTIDRNTGVSWRSAAKLDARKQNTSVQSPSSQILWRPRKDTSATTEAAIENVATQNVVENSSEKSDKNVVQSDAATAPTVAERGPDSSEPSYAFGWIVAVVAIVMIVAVIWAASESASTNQRVALPSPTSPTKETASCNLLRTKNGRLRRTCNQPIRQPNL